MDSLPEIHYLILVIKEVNFSNYGSNSLPSLRFLIAQKKNQLDEDLHCLSIHSKIEPLFT